MPYKRLIKRRERNRRKYVASSIRYNHLKIFHDKKPFTQAAKETIAYPCAILINFNKLGHHWCEERFKAFQREGTVSIKNPNPSLIDKIYDTTHSIFINKIKLNYRDKKKGTPKKYIAQVEGKNGIKELLEMLPSNIPLDKITIEAIQFRYITTLKSFTDPQLPLGASSFFFIVKGKYKKFCQKTDKNPLFNTQQARPVYNIKHRTTNFVIASIYEASGTNFKQTLRNQKNPNHAKKTDKIVLDITASKLHGKSYLQHNAFSLEKLLKTCQTQELLTTLYTCGIFKKDLFNITSSQKTPAKNSIKPTQQRIETEVKNSPKNIDKKLITYDQAPDYFTFFEWINTAAKKYDNFLLNNNKLL